MTDWKPGDRFELEWEGVVIELESEKIVQVRLSGHADTLRFYTESFDAHATKIPEPLEFGDRVWCKLEDADFHEAVVLASDNTEASVWIKGAVGRRNVSVTRINLMHPRRGS